MGFISNCQGKVEHSTKHNRKMMGFTHKTSDDSDREEFIKRLQEQVDLFYRQVLIPAGINEPDWGPLERVVPPDHWGDFMWLGYETTKGFIQNKDGSWSVDKNATEHVYTRGKPLFIYKHRLTRRSLVLDAEGNTYKYSPFSLLNGGQYIMVPKQLALNYVLEDWEDLE